MGKTEKLCTLFKFIPNGRIPCRGFFLSFRAMAPIEEGDNLPPVDLYENDPDTKVNICDITSGKKVIIFGVPGPFTPGCSKTHLPGYVKDAEKLKKEQCLDEIVCVSVSDPFVMAAWGKTQKAAGKVRLLADTHGCFAKALDLTIDLPKLGGLRMSRFSMVVEDNEVIELNVEPDGTGLTCSLAKNIGKKDDGSCDDSGKKCDGSDTGKECDGS